MKKTYFYISFLLIIHSFSCKNNEIELEQVSLKRDIMFGELSDSTYISDIRGIDFNNNMLYLTDYKRNQLIILDTDLEIINTLGSSGKGPGEFIGASQLTVMNDSIYVLNDGKRTIEVFNQLKHVKTIEVPDFFDFLMPKRFVKTEDNLFLSYARYNKSICRYNPYKKEIFQFGLLNNYKTHKETLFKNQKHILKFEDKIIAVPDKEPYLEMYSNSGEFISKMDFSNIDIFTEMKDFISKQKNKEKSYYIIVPDAYIYLDKLYLILLTRDNKVLNSNKVLEIKITDSGFHLNKVLLLKEGWFETICSFEDKLIAFDNKNGVLVTYKLN